MSKAESGMIGVWRGRLGVDYVIQGTVRHINTREAMGEFSAGK